MKLGCQGDTEDVAGTTVQQLLQGSEHGAPAAPQQPNPPEKLQATGFGVWRTSRGRRVQWWETGSMEAEQPNLPVSPGVFIFSRGAAKERLKLPTNFTKLPVE